MKVWFQAYEEDLETVFSEAEKTLSKLPDSFRPAGLKFLDKFHVLKEGRSKNYISYLLPLWLRDCSHLSVEDSRKFALANIFGLLYFQIVDDVMDNPHSSPQEWLPLANLLQLEFISIYNTYFPAESPFWNYYRTYLQQWAEAVTHENRKDYFRDSPLGMAHKAAPVKLSIASSMILSGQTELIPVLEDAVDHTLITLQMLDDLKDWKKDLEDNNYNSLIAFVRIEERVSSEEVLSEEMIEQAIFIGDCLLRYAEFALAKHIHVEVVQQHAPHLRDFNHYLLEELQNIAVTIRNDRILLEKGGLNYWLSKNV